MRRLADFMRLSPLLALLFICVASLAAGSKPNILVILSDDQGYNDVGFNGGKAVPTPNLDALAAVGFALCGVTHDSTLGLIAISVAAAGVMGMMAVQWSLPGSLLSGTAAAAGIALVNSCGNLGGFVSPFAIGKLTELTHAAAAGLFLTSDSLILGAGLLLATPGLEPSRSR